MFSFLTIILGCCGLMIFGVIIFVIAERTTGQTVAWQGQCTMQDYDATGEKAALILNCGDQVKRISDSAVVVSFMKRSGPLSCQINGLGDVSCTPNT